jgi:nitroreductase
MTVSQAITERRTIRKFTQEEIPFETLKNLVYFASLAPSASNIQPLKYKIITKSDACRMFPYLKWAGYIAPEGDPKEGEEPTAYIVVLADTDIRKSGWEHDCGASVQNILLGAFEQGIASCWLGAIDRPKIAEEFDIPEKYYIDSVLAFGYPAEESVAEPKTESIKYYKDENKKYHIPKRTFEEIII